MDKTLIESDGRILCDVPLEGLPDPSGGVEKQSAGTKDFGDTTKRGISYTAVVTGANEKANGGHENSCDEEVSITDDDVRVNRDGPFPVVQFSNRAHELLDHSMRKMFYKNEDDDRNDTNNVSVVAPSMGVSVSAQTHGRALKEAG
ncbi:hypothetical protein V6N12_059175 [Hibiscus sabdariffa]|uniref:Uncharacterized protein n=1 Tax=Hibiscus sabdariffa TaxID=183260 RepID=A0ABR2EUC8_9ROSI